MNINVIKFSEEEWVIVPPRNTINEIIDIYTKLSLDEFKELLDEFIIKDKNGKPDILTATAIVRKINDAKNITFQLYSIE